MPALNLRRNFSWNLVGSTVYNVSQWLLMVLLARLAAPEVVGQFALSLAISAPVFLCIGLNLRIVLATDAIRRWKLSQYLSVRSITGLVSIAVTVIVGFLLHLRGLALLSLAVLAVAKSIEALGQTLYGYYQLHGRLDYVAGSMLLRAAMGCVLFFGAFALTHQLVFACCGLAVGWALTLIFWDNPHRRRLQAEDPLVEGLSSGHVQRDRTPLRALVKTAAPLGIDAGLNSLTINVPRYGIQLILGAAHLGRFAVLAYFAQVVTMITGSLADGIVSQLAHAYAAGQRHTFERLLLRLCLFSMAIGLLVFVGCVAISTPVISFVLGPAYVDEPLLLLLVLSAAVTTLQRCICRGLQATQQFPKIAITDAVSLALVAASCVVLVPRFTLNGAAMSISIGAAAGTILAGVFLRRAVRSFPAGADEAASADMPRHAAGSEL